MPWVNQFLTTLKTDIGDRSRLGRLARLQEIQHKSPLVYKALVVTFPDLKEGKALPVVIVAKDKPRRARVRWPNGALARRHCSVNTGMRHQCLKLFWSIPCEEHH